MADTLERLRAALADRYAIDRELGAGGMATVYLATDLKHDRPVALKVLRPELAASLGTERFLAEIRLTARLQHPHIVALFDSGEADGFLYYVMPCIEGESLRARMDREKRLDLEAMLAVARPVAQALAYAHDRGVVHRDIKPENILLSGGQPFVTDFGVARAVSVAGGAHLTATGVVVGTPAYMSPEQVLGEEGVDARSDIYSLGCVIYEMLSGTPPFTARTLQALLAKRLTGPPPHLTDVPAPVDEVVLKSLATAPQDRFTTAIALADALVEAAHRPATPEKSLVVLPFENLSPDPDNAFFADGLTEELIADLSQVRALRVISRTSAMHFKGTTKALPDIARELNVRYVLEGSVRRAGNSLRITAQLIDARSDAHLWAEKYSGTLEDVFDLQERLSRQIVEALRVKLTAAEDQRLAARATSNVEAYQLYLKGQYQFVRRYKGGLQPAMKCFQEAIRIDPDCAPAFAGLADCYSIMGVLGSRPRRDLIVPARDAAGRAVLLDDSLPEARHALALVHMFLDWRWDVIEREFQRALELNPNLSLTRAYYAMALTTTGRVADVIREAEQAVAFDPLSTLTGYLASVSFHLTRRYGRAVEEAERILELDADSVFGSYTLGVGHSGLGRHEEAIADLNRAVVLSERAPWFLMVLGVVTARAGRHDEARRVIDELTERSTREYIAPSFLGHIHGAMGDAEHALDALEQDAREQGTLEPVTLAEPLAFDSIRGHPRFRRVASSLGYTGTALFSARALAGEPDAVEDLVNPHSKGATP
jgi:eukaryotic-like serine/threonine-protein kinase